MWKVRRVALDTEIILTNVYYAEEEPIYLGNTSISWYVDNDEAKEKILEAFREPVIPYFKSKAVF
jgi:hypothetical protein